MIKRIIPVSGCDFLWPARSVVAYRSNGRIALNESKVRCFDNRRRFFRVLVKIIGFRGDI